MSAVFEPQASSERGHKPSNGQVMRVTPADAGDEPEAVVETLNTPNLERVPLAELPSQARVTYRLIFEGGPFPFEKDGTVFFNRERILPRKPKGYYREYTVKTPTVTHRGARRIVCGGDTPTEPVACFFTDDHYASFQRITP